MVKKGTLVNQKSHIDKKNIKLFYKNYKLYNIFYSYATKLLYYAKEFHLHKIIYIAFSFLSFFRKNNTVIK